MNKKLLLIMVIFTLLCFSSTVAADTVLTTITVGDGPYGVGVNPSTNRIYVANYDVDTVSVINGSTNGVITTITVGNRPYGVGVNPSTNRIYVSNVADDTVSVIGGAAYAPVNGETAVIESNTTITQIKVTKNTLHFKATGPTGQTGWINVTFPMVNVSAIHVFINNVPLIPPPFPEITSNGTHYFIYFEFTLSTHDIAIQFAPSVPVGGVWVPINKTELVAPWIGLASLITVASIVYVKRRKKQQN